MYKLFASILIMDVFVLVQNVFDAISFSFGSGFKNYKVEVITIGFYIEENISSIDHHIYTLYTPVSYFVT